MLFRSTRFSAAIVERASTEDGAWAIHLPGVDIEEFFGEMGDDDGTGGELAAGEGPERPLSLLSSLVLDVNLADAGVDAGTAGTRDFDFQNLAVLGALLFNVFLDICDSVSKARLQWPMQCVRTKVGLLVQKLVVRDHVH